MVFGASRWQRFIEMVSKKGSGPNDNIPDLAHLIRSVQRIEGNPDCFGSVNENCDRQNCAWFEYCMKETQKVQLKKER